MPGTPNQPVFNINPAIATVLPATGWIGGGGAPPVFFCQDDTAFCRNVDPAFFQRPAYIGGNDSALLDSTLTDGYYPEAVQWTAARDLYHRLSRYPELMAGDPELTEFYQSVANSSAGQFEAIPALMEQVDARDSVADTLRVQLTAKLALFEATSYTLTTDETLTEPARAALQGQSEALGEAIALLTDALAQRVADQHAVIEQAVYDAMASNAAIAWQEVFEYNQQVVNRILFSVFEQGLTPDSSQLDTLRQIAFQCPVSGGTAVFQARGAIALYEPQTLYGDVETCYGSGINYRPAAPSAPEALEGADIKLYPNPATDEVTIEAPESVQSWELLDLQGRSIFSGTGNSLFVQSVSPGVYALRITTEMGISTHLLTISR